MTRTCTAPSCDRVHLARGLCRMHYERVRRRGTIAEPSPADPAARFWAKVDRSAGPDACWLWTAGVWTERYGYGKFQFGVSRATNQAGYAHRFAWEASRGPVPDGLFVLHHCDTPPCCNPAHLFLGTQADNVADMVAKGRHWAHGGAA